MGFTIKKDSVITIQTCFYEKMLIFLKPYASRLVKVENGLAPVHASVERRSFSHQFKSAVDEKETFYMIFRSSCVPKPVFQEESDALRVEFVRNLEEKQNG